MKVEHVKEQQKEVTYPCLMIGKDTGVIVLMIDKSEGVAVLYGNSIHKFGEYRVSWNMNNFTPLPSTEQIILQND